MRHEVAAWCMTMSKSMCLQMQCHVRLIPSASEARMGMRGVCQRAKLACMTLHVLLYRLVIAHSNSKIACSPLEVLRV